MSGNIPITAEELSSSKDEIELQFRGRNLDNKSFWSTDPFFIIYKSNENGEYTNVYKSEKVRNTLNPTWTPFRKPVRTLCNSDYDRNLRISLFDHRNSGDHKLIGHVHTTLNELKQKTPSVHLPVIHPEKQKRKAGYTNSGQLTLANFALKPIFSFLDDVNLQVPDKPVSWFRRKSIPSSEVKKPEVEEDIKEIGQICLNRNVKLGNEVFRGTFEEGEVAVKRLLKGNYELSKRELDLLRKSGEHKAHENIARFFCSAEDMDFYYLALELGQCTVEDWLQTKTPEEFRGLTTIDSIQLLREISEGVNHLHNLKIVHRDIKPTNILLSYPDNRGHVRAMITDFGLSKRIKDCNNFSMSGVKGSKGWMAPEVLRKGNSKINFSLAVDIFSLGCVFCYLLKPKYHPFGGVILRDSNILRNKINLMDLPDCYFTAVDLVRRMIAGSPEDRPTISAVLNHPMFWTSETNFSFLQDASDRLELENVKKASGALVRRLEQESAAVFGIRWSEKISSELLQTLLKSRVYNEYSVKDLLRLIRNVKNHYQDLPKSEQETLGPNSESYRDYFTVRFPKLLLQTWHVMRLVKTEPIFLKYYIDDQITVEEQDTGVNPVMNKSVAVRKPISNPKRKNVSKQKKANNLKSPATKRQIQINQLSTNKAI